MIDDFSLRIVCLPLSQQDWEEFSAKKVYFMIQFQGSYSTSWVGTGLYFVFDTREQVLLEPVKPRKRENRLETPSNLER